MKLIVRVFLTLTLLEIFHCAPLIGSDDGKYSESHTSSSWGYNGGLDANVGLEGGFKDGHATLGAKKHFGVNVGGHKENDQMDLNHAIAAAPPPNNFGSGFGYRYSGIPNNPANASPYYIIEYAPQPPPPFAPQWPQYARQQAPQFTPQYVPQYAYTPQYGPQNAPQYASQYVPQVDPQYTRQGAPQYAPQGAPYYAQPNKAPDSSQRTINKEDMQQVGF